MNGDQNPRVKPGQSLIELIVVMPVLILLLAAIFPLLVSGTVTPWLDERLWLRQFVQDKGSIQSELEEAHRKNLIPMYFRQCDLDETTGLKKLVTTFPGLNGSYPGYIKIQRILVNNPEGEGAAFGKGNRSYGKTSRNLAMLVSTVSSDTEIPSRVKKLTISGIFPQKIRILKNLNFDLFHLNLDALPSANSEP